MGNTKVVSTLKEGTFTEGFFDLLVYADKVDAKNNKMTGVFIYDGRDAKNPMAIMSKSGMVIPLKSDSELGSAAILKLNEGSIHRSDIAQNSYEKISFDEYRLMLKVEEGATGEVAHAKTLSAPELLSQMDKYKADYGRYQEYAVELWKRSALSLAPILFGLLGVGLGVVRMRSVKSNALFVAFGVVIVYWGLHVVGQSLGEKGLLPPILAMQIPNLAVLPVAVLSFKRSSW